MARKKASEKANDKKSKNFILALIILFLIVAIIMVLTNKLPTSVSQKERQVAADVNGEKIYYDDLNAQYQRVPDQLRETFSEEDLLNQLIERKLLMTEAQKAGITADESRIESTFEDIKSRLPAGKTLEEVLAPEGITVNELRQEISEQVTIASFLEKNVINDLNVTSEELDQYIADTFGNNKLSEETLAQISKFILLQKQKMAYQDYLNRTKQAANIQIFKEGQKMDSTPAAPDEETGTKTGSKDNVQDSVTACLASKGAILYGSETCSYTKQQIEILREDSNQNAITFVECNNADGKLSAFCESTGIEAYPTWVVDGKAYKGTRSLAQLKEISGC